MPCSCSDDGDLCLDCLARRCGPVLKYTGPTNLIEYVEAQQASGRRDAVIAWFANLPAPPQGALLH
jgi:hypothetical protein